MSGSKKKIPLPVLAERYRWLRDVETSQKQHLDWALKLETKPATLARWTADSIRHFAPYDNRKEPFRPTPTTLDPTDKISTGHELARALWNGANDRTWTIESEVGRKRLTMLDYEVPPARTTAKAPCFENEFENGKNSLYIRTDLLLRHPDGTPVVGEAKVAKSGGFDSDTVLALIQALASAAMLATPNQFARLHECYPSAATATRIDVALFLYKPDKLASSTFQRRLEAIAWMVAHRAMGHPTFPKAIRSIYFVDVAGPPQDLQLRAWAIAGEQ